MDHVNEFLTEAQLLIASGEFVVTVKAAREIASMGLTVDEATDILAGLHGDDFYRTEDASIDETTLYVFAPDFEEGALWIRLIIVDGLVVISFHPARHDL